LALPIRAPSTFTCTLEIAVPELVVLSKAQPVIITVPGDTKPPVTGDSIVTAGRTAPGWVIMNELLVADVSPVDEAVKL